MAGRPLRRARRYNSAFPRSTRRNPEGISGVDRREWKRVDLKSVFGEEAVIKVPLGWTGLRHIPDAFPCPVRLTCETEDGRDVFIYLRPPNCRRGRTYNSRPFEINIRPPAVSEKAGRPWWAKAKRVGGAVGWVYDPDRNLPTAALLPRMQAELTKVVAEDDTWRERQKVAEASFPLSTVYFRGHLVQVPGLWSSAPEETHGNIRPWLGRGHEYEDLITYTHKSGAVAVSVVFPGYKAAPYGAGGDESYTGPPYAILNFGNGKVVKHKDGVAEAFGKKFSLGYDTGFAYGRDEPYTTWPNWFLFAFWAAASVVEPIFQELGYELEGALKSIGPIPR